MSIQVLSLDNPTLALDQDTSEVMAMTVLSPIRGVADHLQHGRRLRGGVGPHRLEEVRDVEDEVGGVGEDHSLHGWPLWLKGCCLLSSLTATRPAHIRITKEGASINLFEKRPFLA